MPDTRAPESPDRDRLGDILTAMEQVRDRLPASVEELAGSGLLQIWIVYHLQVIGEAANGLSPALVAAHPEVPWQRLIALRDLRVRRDAGADPAIVRQLAAADLPALEEAVRAVRAELS
jgi:uncharacterized protein with HEPN domain